ncbi:MAG TPA: hypothetical protein DIT21_02760 [Oscillibacter sp.]|nr:hypothetical protein [Oscillibacter sp.]
MCVGKNTAQAASVEFCRFAAKLCAQQTAGPLSEKSKGFFDSNSSVCIFAHAAVAYNCINISFHL